MTKDEGREKTGRKEKGKTVNKQTWKIRTKDKKKRNNRNYQMENE